MQRGAESLFLVLYGSMQKAASQGSSWPYEFWIMGPGLMGHPQRGKVGCFVAHLKMVCSLMPTVANKVFANSGVR